MTALLVDMGMDVVKIEPQEGAPDHGLLRMYGAELPLNFYYQNQNRVKRGIALNLRAEKGKEVFSKMVEKADVFVSNCREIEVKQLGLNAEKKYQ